MFSPKKFFPAIGLLIAVLSLFSQPLYAAQSKYFDYGPYYQPSQVLGFSFSSLENLPAFKLPDNLSLPRAGGVLSDSPFYPLEKVVETVQLTFTFDPVKKEVLRLEIASERLSEAKTLMDQGKTAAASKALDDYSNALTAITQNLSSLAQRTDPQAKDLVNKVEETVSAQTVITTALSLASSPAQAEDWTSAANASRQVLDEVAQAKGEPAIPEDLSTGLQNLKEQGLISEEETNKLYSLRNRSEVREELNKLTSSGELPPSEIVKLDEAVERYYPEVQNQNLTNLQVLELRSYQALPQPSGKVVEELQKWQSNPAVPPSNDIKPYLWYNRAQDLAKEVDLSNFSQDQQSELVKLYPQPVVENPTYSSPPSPSPTPTPVSTDDPLSQPSPQPSAAPSPTPSPAKPYLEDAGGALPGQPTYIIKQLGEGLAFTFTFDPVDRAKLKIQQAERRLAEAEALSSDPKKSALYESTLASYRTSLADASNRIKGLNNPKAAKQVAEQLEAQASRHEVIFEKGLLPPPAKNPKLISDAIKATEDAMDRSADILDRPALPRVLSSRLDDLKAQGLILSEEAEDLVRSNSREEVREKIRKLVELKTFPLADAKKLDEAQNFTSPADYNQLIEVRKVEELQNLRATQTDLAQTPTLKAQATNLDQKASSLTNSFDPTLIKQEDLGKRENLVKTYEKLASVPRPINGGQFGAEATPGAQPEVSPPSPRDAVLSTCPEGATFKQFEGCVWADSGKKINDYEQYKCEGPRQYYSFAAKKCVVYDPSKGYQEDSQPICPVGYQWSWSSQSCQTSRGNILPYPSPSPEPEPIDDEEREKRSKSCPEGSSYQAPKGCVWDDSGKSVYDPEQYRCVGRGQYYSFEEQKCVVAPKEGEVYPKDTTPACKEPGTFWNWSAGKCLPIQPEKTGPLGGPVVIIIDDIKPTFVSPGNPFYFLKQAAERVQQFTAFTPAARGQVTLAQAEERLAEAVDALKKDDQQGAKKAISAYTTMMQDLVADLSKTQLAEAAKNQIAKRLSQEAVEHNLLLQKLQALAPAEQDTPINAAVSASILVVDKAADIAGEPPIPDEVKSKIESLPEKMISEEDKKALLEMDSRVDARIKLGGLITNGALTQTDTGFLNEDFDKVDPNAKLKVEELQKLEEIATATESKEKLLEKVEKNEEIAQKLQEFEKTFEVGKEIPAEIRPYVRLTRINEVAQTIRPDIVRLDEFQNRKDILLAVATLQEEFKPTKEAWKLVEDFRKRFPGTSLPPDLARVEALSYSLGVRQEAGPCYLPTPPFPANTPCPAPGAAIPVVSYATGGNWSGWEDTLESLDKDGQPLVYGQGPKPASAGVCPTGSHWMYDSGGWCMSDSGNYSSSYSYTPSGTGSGYTPYSSYYTAPGAPPATFGYPVGDPNSYPSSSSSYSPPSYYGTAPTYYTTNPPAGTVPGSGPRPTAQGQCSSGYHWMSDSGGWCMADGPTYVPGGLPPSSYPSGTTTGNYYSPNLTQSSCGPGYYWDGRGCIPTYSGGSGTYSGGSTTYSSGYNPSSGSCTQRTCGSNEWFDWGTCSCRPSGNTYTPSSGTTTTSGSTTSSGGGTSSSGSSSGSCPSGYHWMSDNGGWCMQDGGSSGSSSSTSTSTTTSSPTTSSSPAPTTTESAPTPFSAPSTESAPPPSSQSAPPPTESAPAPAPSP